MPSKYTAELKATVIVGWKAGLSEPDLAALTGVPRTTLQKWVKGLSRAPKTTAGDLDLDAMAAELVGDVFASLRAIARAAQDDSWIKSQSAADVAVLFGVQADKLIRLLAAGTRHVDREDGEPDLGATGATALPPGPGGGTQPG